MKKIYLFLLGFFFISNLSIAHIYVILNSNNSIENLNKTDIENIYTLKKKNWDNGSKIIVIDNKDENASKKFYGFFGKQVSDFRKIWLRAQFSGEGQAPLVLNNDDEVIQKVSNEVNSIGFVTKKDVGKNAKIAFQIE